MKRNDFIINNSSSNFIIAFHKDCKQEVIRQMLEYIKEDIKNLLPHYDNNWYYVDSYDDDKNDLIMKYIHNNNYNDAVCLIIDTLASFLYGYNNLDNSLKLKEWNIFIEKFSNETDCLLSIILYYFGDKLNGELFKMKKID